MLQLVFQCGKALDDSLALCGLLSVFFSRHSLVHIIDGAGLGKSQLVIGDYVASAYHPIRTRMIGHLSLADVYANEFLSDVTDWAAVKHALISVVVLQTVVKSTQASPRHVCRRRHSLRLEERRTHGSWYRTPYWLALDVVDVQVLYSTFIFRT